jgi:hypothetical protein
MPGYSKRNQEEQAALASGVSEGLCGQGTKLRVVAAPEALRRRLIGSGKLKDCRGSHRHL